MRRPLVLVIDSAGARLDQGLKIQGALRGLMTDILDAGFAGLPMIALLGRNVFGGASMLAFAASERCYASDTVLAMSGPRGLASSNGWAIDAVRAEINGPARCSHGGSEQLLDDSLSAYATALRGWVSRLPDGLLPDNLDDERRVLGARLKGNAPASTVRFAVDPKNQSLTCSGRAYIGAAGALEFAVLVDKMDSCSELRIDCAGHSLQMGDESLILTQYLVHLARTLRRSVHRRQPLKLSVVGEISGGIYIATAGSASSVEISRGGSVRTLPQRTLSAILTSPDAAISNAGANFIHYLEWGIADIVSAPAL